MGSMTDYFGGEKRFYIILSVLFIMWLGIMVLFYLKADEVTKHPCQICAKEMDKNLEFYVGFPGSMSKRVYYPNFTVENSMEGENNVLP